MHLTWYCMDPSILFHAQRGTLGKKTKFNSLMVEQNSCFHLLQGHSTKLQMRHHVSVILDTNFQKTIFEHLHYFHTWSCLLPSKYKEVFNEFPKTKDAKTLKQHQQFFLECIVVIIVDDINVEVISITCIGFVH